MKKTSTLRESLPPGIAKVLKRLHAPLDVILQSVRWYVAYSLSLRDLEEMLAERGMGVDHSTVHRWVMKLVPLLEKAFRKHKRPLRRQGPNPTDAGIQRFQLRARHFERHRGHAYDQERADAIRR